MASTPPMPPWPVWATERVRVDPPDGTWRLRGELQCQVLAVALAPWLVAAVEHVGSTAVPGLPAKPVLDLQAAVLDLGCAPLISEALTGDGWHYVPPELDQQPWRRFFVKVEADRRIAHLHVMAAGSARWTAQLAFRDALRADPALAQRYGALKQALADEHAEDREAYTAAKADFIRTTTTEVQAAARLSPDDVAGSPA